MVKELILPVKQGEEFNRGFTIKANGSPMDLSEYHIRFQVKRTPLEKAEPIIDKDITTVSDDNIVGRINDAVNGQFFVHLTKEDTSYPTGDYSLIIALEADEFYDIISSKCCNKAIYKICEQ